MELIAEIISVALNELYEQNVLTWTPYGNCPAGPDVYNAHMTITSEPGTLLATCSVNGWLIYLRCVEGMWEAYTAIEEHHIEWRAA